MKVFIFMLIALFAVSLGYDCKRCYGDMCCNIPGNHVYYLTDFCGGAGETACGYPCNAYTYFTADKQRFGCNSYLNLCAAGKCLKAKVIDAGPADWVERDAGMPIIDSSVPTCRHFTGRSSCGWSDRFKITAVPTLIHDESELGPFNVTEEEYRAIVSEEQLEFDKEWFAQEQKKNEKQAASCCTPPQWQGYQFSWDEKYHFRAGFNISYDFTNERFSIIAFEGRGSREKSLESIALYKNKKVYIIDHTTKSCQTQDLDGPMEPDCVPAGAVKVDMTLGGTTKAKLWDYDIFNKTVKVFDVRSEECIPINTAMIDRTHGVDVSFTWDVTPGIKNTTVFDIPTICTAYNQEQPSHPRYEEFVALTQKAIAQQSSLFHMKW